MAPDGKMSEIAAWILRPDPDQLQRRQAEQHRAHDARPVLALAVRPRHPQPHGDHGQASVQQPAGHAGFAVMVFGVIVPVLALVAGLAAVWLLWRPASTAFFKPHRTQPW